ncbi:hypothetical protein A4X13_0g5353 [Tilletia indica]|uniref:Uncharacterized protein n=1 Tax=Tilletia indica TaxID=43049 RepID=A0A177TQF3_9BASI|nr:hypothetical protein A4X13_0g5353 [Tilletia indica]
MSAAPQLPPRTYPRSPLALYSAPAVTRPVSSYERYRVLLAFFRRLSFTLTLTGSAAAIVVYLWRRYFLPKWTETNDARSKVAVKQADAWEELAPKMRAAGRRGGGLALRVAKVEQEGGEGEAGDEEGKEGEVKRITEGEHHDNEDDEEVLDLSAPLPITDKAATSQDGSQEGDESTQQADEPPRSPRLAALDLSKLMLVEDYASKPSQLANKNALPASSKVASALLTSLSGLNADISTHAFLAGSRGTSSFLSSSSSSSSSAQQQSQKASSDLAQIKAEIRSLKGLLLSRRNFGYARPTTSVQ